MTSRLALERRKARIAFGGELVDPQDPGRLTASFTVHWEANAGRRWKQGPEGVSIDEAIAWGRTHAPVVSVLVGGADTPFSAGDEEPPGAQLPRWPTGGLVIKPRPVGMPPDGRQQVREWWVRSQLDLSSLDDAAARRLSRLIEKESDVTHVTTRAVRSGRLVVEFRVTASGLGAANSRGHRLVETAARRVLGGLDIDQLKVETAASIDDG